MHSAFAAIGRFSVRFRRPLLILWIAAAMVAVQLLPSLSSVTPTVTSAGLVLAGTFGVLAISGSSSGNSRMRDAGTGLALGILLDTFLVRTLLVPSAVLLLGRWNWWPSKSGTAMRSGRLLSPMPSRPGLTFRRREPHTGKVDA